MQQQLRGISNYINIIIFNMNNTVLNIKGHAIPTCVPCVLHIKNIKTSY